MFLGTNYLGFVCDIFVVEYLLADVLRDKLLGICVRYFCGRITVGRCFAGQTTSNLCTIIFAVCSMPVNPCF